MVNLSWLKKDETWRSRDIVNPLIKQQADDLTIELGDQLFY